MQLWTVGHSNQTLRAFLTTLVSHEIALIADVRRFPASRRHPHFAKDALAASLHERGIGYEHFPELGGRRSARKDSPNTAWQNTSFRGYADYMETREFGDAIARLLARAAETHTAIMCAELLWWQCHRGLIADYLKARGHDVVHLVSPTKTEPHPYTSAAAIVDGRLSYRGLI
jgi:uncharacterized protein (DUF488 family)